MAIVIDKQQVRERQSRLERTRVSLKEFFVGIDGVIDELCDAIAVWYTMLDVLSRPVIVNLWGMTGVGKTDLDRRLTESGALAGEPALLLFDEVQRFNTIDDEGKPPTATSFDHSTT
jgi:ATP-dependent Clp protease ATP-binding subunit ClpA